MICQRVERLFLFCCPKNLAHFWRRSLWNCFTFDCWAHVDMKIALPFTVAKKLWLF